jgi:hypothetical protein
MKRYRFNFRLFLIPLGIAAFALAGLAVMLLWNNLLPDILFVNTITFWQALGIFLLCKILFGFGRGGRGCGGGPGWMRHRMEEKFKHMTPEQKEAFKQKMRDRACGPWGRHRFDKNWDDVAEEPAKPTE